MDCIYVCSFKLYGFYLRQESYVKLDMHYAIGWAKMTFFQNSIGYHIGIMWMHKIKSRISALVGSWKLSNFFFHTAESNEKLYFRFFRYITVFVHKIGQFSMNFE